MFLRTEKVFEEFNLKFGNTSFIVSFQVNLVEAIFESSIAHVFDFWDEFNQSSINIIWSK